MATYWTDQDGIRRPVLTRHGPLDSKVPAHRALVAYIQWRDKQTCRICGKQDLPLEIDHLVSCRNGGTHHPSNLQTLCCSCNAIKANYYDSRFGEWLTRWQHIDGLQTRAAQQAYTEGFVDGFMSTYNGRSPREVVTLFVRWALTEARP